MTKLGNLMVRDPFDRAREFRSKDPKEPIRRAFLKLGIFEPAVPLVATPADRPKHVIDAKADASCGTCAQPVWMAPSSWRSRDTWTRIVCMRCLESVA